MTDLDPARLDPRTIAAQGLGSVDPVTRAIVPPIHMATTFERDPDGGLSSGNSYARSDNPTFKGPEAVLAALEGGAGAMLFGSGVAAATAAVMALPSGARVAAPAVMYWGLRKWLLTQATGWGYGVDFYEEGTAEGISAAIRPGETKLVWVETPSNPTWIVTDVAAAAEVAHAAGARLFVDNTVPTPILTQPIALGADIVMHSATKYLNGHSDVIAGALVTARRDEYWARLDAIRSGLGGIPGSVEAWLLARGMRTLHLRVQAACRSAQALAERLVGHPGVDEVLYPGLPGAHGHAVAARQMKGGFGGMLSIRVSGGEAAAVATAGRVRIWKRATSLGSVESLIEHRAPIEGPTSPVPKDLLRLSVGIEAVEDLWADLDRALRG
jgi:cystathionine gamma-synthase